MENKAHDEKLTVMKMVFILEANRLALLIYVARAGAKLQTNVPDQPHCRSDKSLPAHIIQG